MNPNLVYRRLDAVEHTLKIVIRRIEMLEARVDQLDGTAYAREAKQPKMKAAAVG